MARILRGVERAVYKAILVFQAGPEDGPTKTELVEFTGFPELEVRRALVALRASGFVNWTLPDPVCIYFARDWKPDGGPGQRPHRRPARQQRIGVPSGR